MHALREPLTAWQVDLLQVTVSTALLDIIVILKVRYFSWKQLEICTTT